MKLTKVHAKEFQSIRDSNEFDVDEITCLVGKNESGKTALLQALYRLNPIIEEDGVYDVTDDYPRWDVEDYRLDVEEGKREHAFVIRATFALDDDDMATVSAVLGRKALKDPTLTISKGYAGATKYFTLQVDEHAALRHLVGAAQLLPDVKAQLEECIGVAGMIEALATAEQTESVGELAALLQSIQKHSSLRHYIFNELLSPRVPKFLYFDEYYQMKGRANIEALQQRQQDGDLQPSDRPLLGLINLARLDFTQLLNPSRTRELKNRLEGAGNYLTKSVVNYWSQNRYLQLMFDVRLANPEDPDGMRDGTNIWGDVYDTKHRVTTELGTRSRGFVWFFSFLAWYSDIKRKGEHVILLLDEPGLSLHAKAQEDLLRYFEAEVKGTHQLVYTTHSPFMVDPAKFERVRIIQDLSIETDQDLPTDKEGTKVLTDVLEASGDSLFPLQGALGYEIYQTLFIGPNSLVVEGVSDLLYIQTMSALLQQRGRPGLSPDWTITPVGGADKVPTFVALIGAHKNLNVAVLIDYQKKDRQTIENLYKRKLMAKRKVITFADFVAGDEADIEDMFEVGFFLKLVNSEFASLLSRPVEEVELRNSSPRVLARLEEYLGATPLKGGAVFNHYRPARHLSENLSVLAGDISDATFGRFEQAFDRLNKMLKK